MRLLRAALVVAIGVASAAESDKNEEGRHSGHAKEDTLHAHKESLLTVSAPLRINCSRPVCEGPLSEIYCTGPILSAAWQLNMQATCPGPKLRRSSKEVVDNFNKLNYPFNASTFASFCEDSFTHTKYLENVTFREWDPKPRLLDAISNSNMRRLALEINRRWNTLGRRFTSDVLENPSVYPVIPVPHPFIVPGGEFDIYFYWDSYWAIEGLLISNMTLTARDMISNFAHLVETHGFIPNSGKIELSSRTQPPLFTQMLYEYFLYTNDLNFTRYVVQVVEKEIEFWTQTRLRTVTAKGRQWQFFQYKAPSNCPRPENFLIDYWQGLNSSRPAETVWASTASACESGWDFSSRWFAETGPDALNKKSIHTNDIIPLDLNSFMAWNYRSLARIYTKLHNTAKALEYRNRFSKFAQELDEFFWDEGRGIWFDYDIEINSLRKNFYPTNVFPLIFLKKDGGVLNRIAEYLEQSGALHYPGGIPSTLPVNSSEQWDFPNVWAPTTHLFIYSLLSTKDAYLVQKAEETARKFTQAVYMGAFEPPEGLPSGLWEKYDARRGDGSHGGGGEYPIQEGFAWTNGAALHLIMMFEQPQLWGVDALAVGLDHESLIQELFWQGFVLPRAAAFPMLGDTTNTFIVSSLIVFCLALAILFISWTIRASHQVVPRAMRRGTTGDSSLQRLLDAASDDEE